MGLTAGIYAISRTSYDIALAGNPADISIDPTIDRLDLDKAWHAIHHLVTGDASLTLLLSGTQLHGTREHCEVHGPESVAALHNKLSVTSLEAIMARYRPALFSELKIYPGGWSDDAAPYVTQHLQRFIGKIKEISDRRLAMMVVIQ